MKGFGRTVIAACSALAVIVAANGSALALPSPADQLRELDEEFDNRHKEEIAGRVYAGLLCALAAPESWDGFWGDEETSHDASDGDAAFEAYWQSHGFRDSTEAMALLRRHWGKPYFKQSVWLTVQETECGRQLALGDVDLDGILDGPFMGGLAE